MSAETVVVSELLFGGEDEMLDFLSVVERITGAPVVRVREWRLTSESPHAHTILTALVEASKKPGKPSPAAKAFTKKDTPVQQIKRYEKTLPQESLAPIEPEEPERLNGELQSWQVWVGGKLVEAITLSEKSRRLNAGEFETGTLLKHPKAGTCPVIGEKGLPQGLGAE